VSSVEYHTDGPNESIGVVVLNRPERLNSYDLEMLKELEELWLALRDDRSIRVCVLTGSGGRSFSTGHDISWVESIDPREEAIRPEYYGPAPIRYLHGYGSYGIDIGKPLVAAIEGYCLGGGLAMACRCDIRVCAESAQFGVPQVKLGVISPQACTFLPRITGLGIAMEMILTGEMYDSVFAARVGLVNRVVPDGEALSQALLLANRLLRGAPLAQASSKKVMQAALQAPLETALDLGHREFAWLRGTEDARLGIRSFLDKTEPQWRGV
jgi:enoyl-CoA hydratase/carnithine racemase